MKITGFWFEELQRAIVVSSSSSSVDLYYLYVDTFVWVNNLAC